MTKPRVVLFGDPQGVPQVHAALGDAAEVVALVQASSRPAQNAEMTTLAGAMQVPLIVQPLAKSGEHSVFVNRIASLQPHFIFVNSYSMILKPQVLATASKLAVNIHGGLLPQYRGANVTEWALIGEERESGVTAHIMDAGIDTGAILGQRKVPLKFTDTWVDARARINAATEQLLADLLPQLVRGDVQPLPQGEGKHWHRRRVEDGLFSWNWPLRRIYNLVRALVAPHPGAQPDDASEAPLNKWTSLPALAARKFKAIGAWEADGVLLKTNVCPAHHDRDSANARFDFDVISREGTSLGSAALFPDYCQNRARASGARVADAVIAAFCQAELGISEVAVGR